MMTNTALDLDNLREKITTEEKIEQSELPARVRSDAFGMLLPPTNER